NLHILLRLCEVLFVGHVEAKFMIGQTRNVRRFDVLDKLTITTDEAFILRELALLDRRGDAAKHTLISRLCLVVLIRRPRRQHERVNPRRYPCVRLRLHARAESCRSSKRMRAKQHETSS